VIKIEKWWLVNGANWWPSLHLEVSRFIPPSSRINYKRRPAPSHFNTTLSSSQVLLLRRPLTSPSVAFCIPIASTARTVLVRAGLRNLCSAEILLRIARQSGFLGASWRDCSLPEHLRPLLPGGRSSTSSTSWWPNVYVLYIPVVVPVFPKWTSRSSRLLPDGHLHCND
jgi:hypothetical protein